MAVHLSAPKDPKKAYETDVESLRITPSANGGFSVACQKKPEATKGKGHGNQMMPSAYIEPDTYVFSSLRELKRFLDETFA